MSTPEIPDEAIEAGAAALRRSWDDATEYGSAEEMAARALEAAMPLLREQWETELISNQTEFDRWLMAIIEQSRELERQQSRDYATKRREEACALIKATGHAPNDVMEDEFKVNVKLGYYEAWEIEREIDGHPVVEDGRVKRHRIKEDIPEGFNIVYLA